MNGPLFQINCPLPEPQRLICAKDCCGLSLNIAARDRILTFHKEACRAVAEDVSENGTALLLHKNNRPACQIAQLKVV